jgi:FtsH-binding integral membrane protein
MLLQRHLPSRGLLAAVSLCYALSYCLVLQYVAHSTGGWPYPVLARLSMQQRLLFCGASAAALALLALLARGAAAMRSALGEPRGKAASKRL